jgi:hypothetical protein
VNQPDAPPPSRDEVARPARTPELGGQHELGKGGPKHRYLQGLAKELAEAQGLRAIIEAPLDSGGQVDVLIGGERTLAAVEISVSTPVEQEQENIRKCLAAKIPRIAVVLVKSRISQANYRTALIRSIPDEDREKVTFLSPEELPEFIERLAPTPAAAEHTVRGYRVKGSFSSTSPEDARARRDALARLISKSLGR